MSPTNTTTLTVMKTKDGNMTSWMEHTAAPHLDYRMTAKVGLLDMLRQLDVCVELFPTDW
jgi:hypothetical protein